MSILYSVSLQVWVSRIRSFHDHATLVFSWAKAEKPANFAHSGLECCVMLTVCDVTICLCVIYIRFVCVICGGLCYVNVWKTKNLSQYYHDDMIWYMKAITLTFFTKHWFPPEMILCYEDIVHSSSRCCRVDVESRYWSHLIVVHGTLACDMMWLELSTKFCGAAVFQICKDGAFPSSTLKILLRLCCSWDAWL